MTETALKIKILFDRMMRFRSKVDRVSLSILNLKEGKDSGQHGKSCRLNRKLGRKSPACGAGGEDVDEFESFPLFCLLHLVEENRFIDPEELGVPAVSYVLGLADVIGEFRRRALDSLRKGDVKTAENCLQTMEQIYVELMSMDEAYMLVPGLRRKSDVARHIIETTRGDITIEARRNSLEKSLKKLERMVKPKRKS